MRIRKWFHGFIAVIGLALLLTACDSSPQKGAAPVVQPDAVAPDFSLADLSGNSVSLSDYRGKVVIVNFWASWCPPCLAEMPSMETLYRTLKDDGLVLLAVNTEANGRKTVAGFLERNPHTFPVLLDDEGAVQQLYGVFKLPESFVIRKDGTIDDKIIGAIDWAHPEVITYFRQLLEG